MAAGAFDGIRGSVWSSKPNPFRTAEPKSKEAQNQESEAAFREIEMVLSDMNRQAGA